MSSPNLHNNTEPGSVMDIETKYPSVDLAYDIAIDSYEIMRQQWNAMNSIFPILISISTSAIIAVPVIAKTFGIVLVGLHAQASIILGCVAIVVGFLGRLHGTVRILNPQVLYDSKIQKQTGLFKREMIWLAGQDFNENNKRIYEKWQFAVVVIFFLTGQTIALISWFLQL